jgi:hypothetical protein
MLHLVLFFYLSEYKNNREQKKFAEDAGLIMKK